MKVKSENYILIPGWAITKLRLKGNDLIVFSIIYGFSQEKGQKYKGSIQYLADWTHSTRQGVTLNINNLLYWGYIIKEEHSPTNWYYANLDLVKQAREMCNPDDIEDDDDECVNSVTDSVNLITPNVNSVTDECKLNIHNNIDNNKSNNKNNFLKGLEALDITKEVISYFNTICKTNFKSTTKDSQKLIKARLQEGFTIDDLKKVIDYKYETWGLKPTRFGNGQMSDEFLRPNTLFSDKFESYLYEANKAKSSECTQFNSKSVKATDEDRSNITF